MTQPDHNGDYRFTDSHDPNLKAKVEWSRPETRRGEVVIRLGGRAFWIAADEVEAFADAVRDAASSECRTCEGTGKKKYRW
jgi:hypothetical protein